jgi:hypothetical protein
VTVAKDVAAEGRPLKLHVTLVVANHYTFDTQEVTGRQIKEKGNIPVGFSLYRRAKGGNEPIHDDESVALRNGDHFFARPSKAPSTYRR